MVCIPRYILLRRPNRETCAGQGSEVISTECRWTILKERDCLEDLDAVGWVASMSRME